METRQLGSLDVTIVGLGTNNFGFWMKAEEVPPVVDAALDAGINLFDTSDSYADSEQRIGQALQGRRDRVVIATKLGNPVPGQAGTGGARPEYVRRAVDASLRRLRTDRIDLYQIHRPDPAVPMADTLGALAEIVAAGKVREIGCSNFSAAQLREAHAAAGDGPHFVSVQNHYNLLNRADEADVLPVCRELGIAYLPYFPLASGLLTGKYRRGEKPAAGSRLDRMGDRGADALSDVTFDRVEALGSWVEARSRSSRSGLRLAGRPAGGRVGYCRRDQGRAGRGERGRRGLAAFARRTC
jgi:aryl-alcohol dehydrogenase-like predicted oxidoreductase